MSGIPSNRLPQDPIVRRFSSSPVESVAEYIQRVNEYIQLKQSPDSFFVYRGEPEKYPVPCRPNLFRGSAMSGNPFFEKGLCNAMRQSSLTNELRYLDNAIDAQHGEFPSRLLDVTYNCLTALYFAVTPYYHLEEDALDEQDGMVYLFLIDEVFSPSAENINSNYNAIINRDKDWYQGKALFEKNHKFIDHSTLNNRIVAQQGAFILFQGDEAERLPLYMSYGIRIPKKCKPAIRRDLKQLFGIHTGSIYPEVTNLVKELTEKSRLLNTDDFTCENELHYTMRLFAKELDYYLDYAAENRDNEAYIDQILTHIERVVNSYRLGLLELWRDSPEIGEPLHWAVEQYNQLVGQFSEALDRCGVEHFSPMSITI